MDWFERLTGFREAGYDETRARLTVVGDRLRSLVNGKPRSFRDEPPPGVHFLQADISTKTGRHGADLAHFPSRCSRAPLSISAAALTNAAPATSAPSRL